MKKQYFYRNHIRIVQKVLPRILGVVVGLVVLFVVFLSAPI
ncbi:UNVERIFIED_CONTAM: hypothetical protein Cloal_0283 [Acetivibrio alkalicellulosi]